VYGLTPVGYAVAFQDRIAAEFPPWNVLYQAENARKKAQRLKSKGKGKAKGKTLAIKAEVKSEDKEVPVSQAKRQTKKQTRPATPINLSNDEKRGDSNNDDEEEEYNPNNKALRFGPMCKYGGTRSRP
jgi:hypothetical protein